MSAALLSVDWWLRSLSLWSVRREKRNLEQSIPSIRLTQSVSQRLDDLVIAIETLERLR